MSSRQEEKERRRLERIEREKAAASEGRRKRLVQIIAGVFVAAAIVVGVVLAASGSGGGSDKPGGEELKTAAQSASCTYGSFPDEGSDHVADELTEADFKTNPPTSGAHNPEPAQDGLYAPGNEPSIKNWVHTLEHGRIILMYKPDAPRTTVDELRKLFNERVLDSGPAYHMVLMRNNTKMSFEVAAVAWRQYMACPELTPQALEALRKFRDARVDQAPEFFP